MGLLDGVGAVISEDVSLSLAIVLEDAPESAAGLDHVLELDDVLEDFGNVSASLVKLGAAQEELDHRVAIYLRVVGEENVVGDVWLRQVSTQHLDGRLGSGMQFGQLLHDVGRLFAETRLVVVALHL